MSNSDLIGSGLRTLGRELNVFLGDRLGANWLDLLRKRDVSKGITGREYSPSDPSHSIRMFTDRLEGNAFRQIGSNYQIKSLASEIREVRNKWAHLDEFSDEDAYRALDSIQRFLLLLGREVDLDGVAELRIRMAERAPGTGGGRGVAAAPSGAKTSPAEPANNGDSAVRTNWASPVRGDTPPAAVPTRSAAAPRPAVRPNKSTPSPRVAPARSGADPRLGAAPAAQSPIEMIISGIAGVLLSVFCVVVIVFAPGRILPEWSVESLPNLVYVYVAVAVVGSFVAAFTSRSPVFATVLVVCSALAGFPVISLILWSLQENIPMLVFILDDME